MVLAVYLSSRQDSASVAGLAFGVAMNIKGVPVLFAPLFFFHFQSWRKRFEFFIAAGAVFIAGSLPYIAQNPLGITKAVFGHGSLYGQCLEVYIRQAKEDELADWRLL